MKIRITLILATILSGIVFLNEYLLFIFFSSDNWVNDSLFISISIYVWGIIVPIILRTFHSWRELNFSVMVFRIVVLSTLLSAVNAFAANLIFHLLMSVHGDVSLVLADWKQFMYQVLGGVFYRWIESVVLLSSLMVLVKNEFRLRLFIANQMPFISRFINGKFQSHLIFKTDGKNYVIPANEIDYVESNGNYVYLINGNEKILYRQTLKHLEEILDNHLFVKVHRSVLINRQAILEITKYKQGEYWIKTKNGDKIRSGRNYQNEVQNLIGSE